MPFLGAGSLLQNDEWIAHGTAVLGIVAAVDNDKGVIGIAPGCSVRVVSQWFDQPNAKFISDCDRHHANECRGCSAH
jgi:hypothetical protein